MTNRKITFILGMLIGAVSLVAQAPTTFTLPPGVWDSVNGSYNYIQPFILNVGPSSQGNYFTFSLIGSSNFQISPSAVNPAGATIAGTVQLNVGSGGWTGTLSALDNDIRKSFLQQISVAGPGTYVATNAQAAGEPVSTATGELYEPGIPADLRLGGPLPLEFRRYYGSLLAANGASGALGNNWMHNFQITLVLTPPFAEVVLPGAKTLLFQQSGTSWQPLTQESVSYQLVSGANNSYQFLDSRTNLIYTFSGTSGTIGVSSIQDRHGNTLTVTSGTTTGQVSDGLGRLLTLTYGANNTLTKVADQTGRSVTFNYTGTDLTSVTDANGNTESFTYTTTSTMNGLMLSHALPLGNKPFSQTWDTTGRVVTQSDSVGSTTTFTYNTDGSTTVKDPLGVVTTDTSRIVSDFTSHADSYGNALSVTYDLKQHITGLTDRLGGKTTRTFQGSSGYLATETDALGNTTTYTWTAQTVAPFTFYNLTGIQFADGAAWSMTYDATGNLLSVTDEDGKAWAYTYNSRGQILTSQDPLGRTTTYAYNAADATLASVTDTAGNVTSYSYDLQKRIRQNKFANGDTRSYAYDNRDNILKRTDERGNNSLVSFNANNKVATLTDATGKITGETYDANERITKATDANGHNASFTYDAAGLLKTAVAAAGETLTYTFDTNRRLTKIADTNGNGSTVKYNNEDLPVSITDALSRTTTFTLDADGHPVTITTPVGERYTIVRDKRGRAVSTADPTGVTTAVKYDPAGRVVGYTVGGKTPIGVTLTRDASGYPTGLTDPNGSTWGFSYDSGGRLSQRTDPLGRSINYTYDTRGRISAVQSPLGTQNFTLDPAGNIVSRAYSDGTNLTYAYDADDRLLTGPGIVLSYDADGALTGSNGLTIGRDADERIASITYAPNKTVTYRYSAAGLPASVTDWTGASVSFAYDVAHQLTALARSNGHKTQYTYDPDGRLSSVVDDAGASIAMQRDAAGRIISETRTPAPPASLAPGVLPLSYDAAEQVAGFTYDGNGEVNADTLRTYAWDAAARLTGYTGADGSATLGYDGFGLRTSRTSQGVTSTYVWNYATSLPSLATVKGASGDQTYYVYAPNGTLLFAIDAATGAHHFYHFDESGSTLLLTGDSGAVTDSYSVTPYGETTTRTGTTDNPFVWKGAFGVMQEGATSLYYVRARYYDSTTARFISPDPVRIANPLEANPYQYAKNDPLNRGDWTGFAPEDVLTAPSTYASGAAQVLDTAAKGLEETAKDSLGEAAKLVPDTATALNGTEGVGELVQKSEAASNLAGKLKTGGQILDGAGKLLDVAKEGVKLYTAIQGAEQEQATLSNATNIGEAAALKALYKLKVQGKFDNNPKEYYRLVNQLLAGTGAQQDGALSGMVIDELTASAVFVENSLAGVAGKAGKAAKLGFEWLGSFWSGTPPPK